VQHGNFSESQSLEVFFGIFFILLYFYWYHYFCSHPRFITKPDPYLSVQQPYTNSLTSKIISRIQYQQKQFTLTTIKPDYSPQFQQDKMLK